MVSVKWLGSGSIYYTGGNVGIGTSSSINERLTIYGTYARQAMFINTAVNTASYIGFYNDYHGTISYIGLDGIGLSDIEKGALVLGTYCDKNVILVSNSAERMRISSSGNVSIGNTDTSTYKLNITDNVNVLGRYFRGGHKQPFSANGTVGAIHYFDIPTLFDDSNVRVHTLEVVFSWEVSGTISDANLKLFAQFNGSQYDPNGETSYREIHYNATTSGGGTGNLLATSVNVYYGLNQTATTKIRMVRSSVYGLNGRTTYSCETIYTKAGIGITQNFSIGFFQTGGYTNTSQWSHIRIGFDNSNALFQNGSKYTAIYYLDNT